MANNTDKQAVERLEREGPGTQASEVQIAPLSEAGPDLRNLKETDIIPGTNVRVSSIPNGGDAAAAPGSISRQQALRPADAAPANVIVAETLPLAPDPDPDPVDLTIDTLEGSEEGYRGIAPLNRDNVDNCLRGPGYVFPAGGIYRDFHNLDRIYDVAAGTIVPRDLYLIADRDLLQGAALSRAVGRKVRTLESAGFVPSVGTATVESVTGAVRVNAQDRVENDEREG